MVEAEEEAEERERVVPTVERHAVPVQGRTYSARHLWSLTPGRLRVYMAPKIYPGLSP